MKRVARTTGTPSIAGLTAFFAAFSYAFAADACPSSHVDVQFVAPDATRIVLDIHGGRFVDQHGKISRLRDCSDSVQFCATDDDGFAYSFPKTCGQIRPGAAAFSKNVVWVSHEHSWVVFDESPGFMFHYAPGRGIVGIYAAKADLQDLREIYNLEVTGPWDLGLDEFKRSGPEPLAACE